MGHSRSILAVVASLAVLVAMSACGGRIGTGAVTPSASSVALQVIDRTIPTGEVGVTFRPFELFANGGTSPYTWLISDGALPDGLTLSSDGWIAGTPTSAGSYTFSVTVKDAQGASASASSSISVAGAVTATLDRSGTVNIETGHSLGKFGSASGGVAPYKYVLTTGAVPPGTTLDGLSLTGAPTTAGRYSFTVTVTDSLGQTAKISPSYNVFAPIHFPPRTGKYDLTYQGFDFLSSDAPNPSLPQMTQLAYEGGTPGVTPTVSFRTLDPNTLAPMNAPETPVDSVAGSGNDGDELTVTVSGGAVHVFYGDLLDPYMPEHFQPDAWYGVVAVTVTDASTHESSNEARILLRVLPRHPGILGVSPNTFPTTGGAFTIVGWGFKSVFGSQGTTSLKIDGIAVTDFVVANDNTIEDRITGTAPPHAEGTVEMELTSNGVTITFGHTYAAATATPASGSR